MIFVAEIYAAIDPEGTESRLLFGTDSWHTGSGGSPANTPVYGRLLQPANFERSIASGKMIFGLTEAGYGECTIANADGAFDVLTTYGVSGRDFRLWACEPTTSAFTFEAFPNFSSWVQIFHATMQSIVGDGTVLRVRLRERVWKMKQKVCPPFLGTGGVEGVAALTGTPKPVVYGGAYNAAPVLLDPAYLTYMISATGDVSAHHLKDSGSVVARQLTSGAQENDGAASFAALQGTTIQLGHYLTHATSGTLKLGSPPVGQVTCDAASTVSDNPSDVMVAIAEAAGFPASGVYQQINSADFAAIESWGTTNDSHVGIYVRDDSTTYGQAIGAIAASIGAWVGFDRWGELRGAIVVDPAGMTSVLDLTEADILSIKPVASDDPGRGVPYATITQKYPRNWTPQSNGLAGVVPSNVRKEIAEEYPLSVVTTCEQLSSSPPATVPITDQFLGAPDYLVESYGVGRRVTSTGALEAVVPAPGSQFAELLGVPRDWFEVTVPFRVSHHEDIEIGACMSVTHRRFGLSAGKQFLVTGIRYELSKKPTATFTVWG